MHLAVSSESDTEKLDLWIWQLMACRRGHAIIIINFFFFLKFHAIIFLSICNYEWTTNFIATVLFPHAKSFEKRFYLQITHQLAIYLFPRKKKNFQLVGEIGVSVTYCRNFLYIKHINKSKRGFYTGKFQKWNAYCTS